jgi:hypothetical protein
MKIVFGMFIGVLLTVALAFAYDSMSGRTANGSARAAADGRPPIVNWDVVSEGWHQLGLNLQALGEDVRRRLGS